MNDWTSALSDVRMAYRLAAAYQERVSRTIQVLAAEFPEHRYYTWDSLNTDKPLSQSRPPHHDVSPWSGLPLYSYSVLLLPRDADVACIRKGECMIEIGIVTDEAFDVEDDDQLGRDGYPDPARMTPAGETRSLLSLVAWTADRTPRGRKSWFADIWSKYPWPDSPGDVRQLGSEGVSNFLMRWNLEEVLAAEDPAVFATRFKASLAETADMPL